MGNSSAFMSRKPMSREMPVTELADWRDADRALPVIGRGPASGGQVQARIVERKGGRSPPQNLELGQVDLIARV